MIKLQAIIRSILVEGFFKVWYRIVNKLDKNAEVIFMNYGFEDHSHPISLDPSDEPNRYPIQLYNQLVREHSLEGKDILEIGCGRGGGLSFVHKLFKPASALGIDRDPIAIGFCKKYHTRPGLSFMLGDAQAINLPDQSFDLIINVESCHRYASMELFLGEVQRLLRPNGLFLLTDFRASHQFQELINQLDSSGLIALGKTNVTGEVVRALELDHNRRVDLVERLVPRFLHKIAHNFSGAKGSSTYRNFEERNWVYYNFYLKKQRAPQPVKVTPSVWESGQVSHHDNS